MGSDKIYLSLEEQQFLTNMLEIDDPTMAVEKFAEMMAKERADPMDLKKYLRKVMQKYSEKHGKGR